MKTRIQFVLGDITKQRNVEAIVNAANCSLLGGGGVDGAIHRAAGPQLLEECRRLHGCETGDAKLTKAYELPCDYIIHTVGPIWYGGMHQEEEMLASCYKRVLEVAQANHIRSLAFPSISTGAFHFPLERAVSIAITTTCAFVQEHDDAFDMIAWVLFDQHTYDVYQNAYKNYS